MMIEAEAETADLKSEGQFLDAEEDEEYISENEDDDELIDYDEELVISRLKGMFRPLGHTSNKQTSSATQRYQPNEKCLEGRYGAQLSSAEQSARRSEQRLARGGREELAADSRGNYSDRLTNASKSAIIAAQRADERDRERTRDKSDRATCEQALDARTRIILFKLLARGALTQIDGCVSTGKEANVYYARGRLASRGAASYGTIGGEDQLISEEERELAVKVFKTSVLHFKDRDRYVTGEFRWRRGYARANPRKLVRLWAEKEMRNLVRMRQAGLPVPEAMLLRGNVLVMQFVGEGGNAAPLLQNVEFGTREPLERAYLDILLAVRTMFQRCKLVHADLSAFNMLYLHEKVWIIDVSQAVEHDHPNALEFLRNDLRNVSDFFRKRGLQTPTVRALFDYVTSIVLTEQEEQPTLQQLYAAAQLEGAQADADCESEKTPNSTKKDDNLKADEDEILRQVYIPRTLNDARVNFERDFYDAARGESDRPVFYKQLLGLKSDLSGAATRFQPNHSEHSSDSESESNSDESVSDAPSTEDHASRLPGADEKKRIPITRDRNESPNSRRIRKQAVKEEQRERRKEKMPKNEKKRKMKTSKQRH